MNTPSKSLVDRIAEELLGQPCMVHVGRDVSIQWHTEDGASEDPRTLQCARERAQHIIALVQQGEPMSEGEHAALEAMGRREGMSYK